MMSARSTLRTTLASALLAAASLTTLGMASASAQPAPAASAQAAPAPGAGAGRRGPPQEPPLKTPIPTEAERPDLYKIPALPKYTPKKTAWGDPDFRGIWPIDSQGGLPLQRTAAQGRRVFLTDEEFSRREAAMEKQRGAAAAETKSNKLGMGNWVEQTGAGRRTSLLIDPPNGRLPELTPYGKQMDASGRSSWVRGQTYDWVDDFDTWDHCVTRGFPASMLPFHYNNGIQVFQAPGYVVISLEMIHDSRIIPLDGHKGALPPGMTSWMGDSHGHWEGNTLVIETDHIRTGASPLNMATIGAPANNTIPMSPQSKVVERLTMTGPDTIAYEMTFSDPVVWTAPFTVRLDWTRNEKYGMFEYACHEGDIQVRNYIKASRSDRAKTLAQGGATPQPAAQRPPVRQ